MTRSLRFDQLGSLDHLRLVALDLLGVEHRIGPHHEAALVVRVGLVLLEPLSIDNGRALLALAHRHRARLDHLAVLVPLLAALLLPLVEGRPFAAVVSGAHQNHDVDPAIGLAADDVDRGARIQAGCFPRTLPRIGAGLQHLGQLVGDRLVNVELRLGRGGGLAGRLLRGRALGHVPCPKLVRVCGGCRAVWCVPTTKTLCIILWVHAPSILRWDEKSLDGSSGKVERGKPPQARIRLLWWLLRVGGYSGTRRRLQAKRTSRVGSR